VAQTGHIWSSKEPVDVMKAEYIDDVYEHIMREITAGNMPLINYESLSKQTKQEYMVCMKNFILERNLLTANSAQSRFWAKYYPEAWKMAEAESVNKSEADKK